MSTFSAAVIAGGKSSRMGTDKAFVKLHGKPMIEHVLERTADLGQIETVIITNRRDAYRYLGLPMVADLLPEKGSLGGIYTAIHSSKSDYTLALACDMPFVNPDLLRHMIALTVGGEYDVIVPRVERYPEALHAIYHKNCLAPILERLEADRLKVIGFYGDVRVRYLDEDEYTPFDPQKRSFMNINTPEDLESAQGTASEQ